jgi:hypothetical protein
VGFLLVISWLYEVPCANSGLGTNRYEDHLTTSFTEKRAPC